MRISSAFPSDYLKAADLQGRPATVIMDRVSMADIGGEPKPILYFQGKDKGMVLNKTNANKILELFGDDTEAWSGGEIVLYEAMVDFQGKTVAAIRVRHAPRPVYGAKPSGGAAVTSGRGFPAAAPVQTQVTAESFDETPF